MNQTRSFTGWLLDLYLNKEEGLSLLRQEIDMR